MLRTLPDESVHCVVTSPPYWGLRDYGVDGQMGLEETLEEYIHRMTAVFGEVHRVLRDDGTLWLNMGDSYNSGTVAERRPSTAAGYGKHGYWTNPKIVKRVNCPTLKRKDMCGVPWRLAFALQAAGWYLRQDIIWQKTNPMPESVTDRCTKSHEYLFLLAKSPRYYYDAEAIREEDLGTDHPRRVLDKPEHSGGIMPSHKGLRSAEGRNGHGRNRRSVWTISTQRYDGAHFATFPLKLVEPCILAGTSQRGYCPDCGAPWIRVVDRQFVPQEDVDRAKGKRLNISHDQKSTPARNGWEGTPRGTTQTRTVGWRATCECYDGTSVPRPAVPGVVIDPFAGTGTVLVEAMKLARQFLGIELNPGYAEMARRRLRESMPLFVGRGHG